MGLPGGPVVKIPLLPMQGTRVRSLLRALRSHMLQGDSACAPQQEKSAHPSKDPVQPNLKSGGVGAFRVGVSFPTCPLTCKVYFQWSYLPGIYLKFHLKSSPRWKKEADASDAESISVSVKGRP